MSDVYDVVIVGAGLMGSAAAYYASKRKDTRVLLLEQFELLHARGSSHGDTRIFRVAYPNGVYTTLCLESLALWQELEALSGTTLIEMTGELDFASERNADLAALEANLTQHDIAFETLTGDEVNARFPGFSIDATSYAVFNKYAGVLNPTRAMATLQTLAQQRGAVVRAHSKVTGIHAASAAAGASDVATIELADGTVFHTRQCIVTAGAWTPGVLEHAPAPLAIQPIATFGTYWKCVDDALYRPATFPVFINYEAEWVYGLPMTDPARGVKICRHDGPAVANPDARAGVAQPAAHADALATYVAKNFAQVDAASGPTVTDNCMYSMTPDDDFIIDFVPLTAPATNATATTKHVVVGAGFSGHGAKMTPVIGKILAELALDGTTTHDISLFRATRPSMVAK